MRGVAFKVTYNDGGAGSGLVGYRGVCSDRMIVSNALGEGAVWCSQKQNPCYMYAKGGFLAGERPRIANREGPCYEATLLSRRPFRFGAGYWHNGPRKDEPIPISGVSVGDLAFLTTILPDGKQTERFVFALFRVGRLYEDPTWGNVVESDGTMDVTLPDDVARDLIFWDFQPANRDGSMMWGSGLFRYLEPPTVAALLGEILFHLGDLDERDTILKATEFAVKPTAMGGHRGGHPGTGEGAAHRELKDRVAADPTLIGLPAGARATKERAFITDDRVDIWFDLPDGTVAVVEVETYYTLIGTHQAVKYRALAQAERGEPLSGGGVLALLVAHQFDDETTAIGDKYGVRLVTLPPKAS